MSFHVKTFFQKESDNLSIPDYLKDEFNFNWEKSVESDFFDNPRNEDLSSQLKLKKAPLYITFSRRKPLGNSFLSRQNHGTTLNHILKHYAFKDGDALFIQGVLSSLREKDDEYCYMTVKTADCLSVVLYYLENDVLLAANVHAGWRGYSSGILGISLDEIVRAASYFSLKAEDVLKYLNVLICPAIFAINYECSYDVLDALEKHGDSIKARIRQPQIFDKFYRRLCNLSEDFQEAKKITEGKVYPDLQLLAMIELNNFGIPMESIEIIRENTYYHPFFYSHRQNSLEGNLKRSTCRHFTNFFIPRLQNVSLPNIFNRVKS